MKTCAFLIGFLALCYPVFGGGCKEEIDAATEAFLDEIFTASHMKKKN